MGGGGSSYGGMGNYTSQWQGLGQPESGGVPPLHRLFSGGTPLKGWSPAGAESSGPATGDLGFPLSQFPLKKPGVPIDMANLDATDWYGNPYQDIQAKTQFPPPPFINNNAQGYKML